MRVLLADDQTEVRSALRLLLEQLELCIAGEVADRAMLPAAVEALEPDLVLLDWELGARRGEAPAGREMIRELRARQPQVAIIALSSHPEVRAAALAAGADGFVSKGDAPDALLAALRKHHQKLRPSG